MSNARTHLKVAKWAKPKTANLIVDVNEHGKSAEYDYLFDAEQQVDIDDISWLGSRYLGRRKMNFARNQLHKATQNTGEYEMVLNLSEDGEILDYFMLPEKQLVRQHGKVPKSDATRNYQLYYQNKAEQLLITPSEDGGAELTPTREIKNVVNNVHLDQLMTPPEKESESMLANLDMKTIVPMAIVAIVVLTYIMG